MSVWIQKTFLKNGIEQRSCSDRYCAVMYAGRSSGTRYTVPITSIRAVQMCSKQLSYGNKLSKIF